MMRAKTHRSLGAPHAYGVGDGDGVGSGAAWWPVNKPNRKSTHKTTWRREEQTGPRP